MFRVQLFEPEGLLDFVKFGLDKVVCGITIRMILASQLSFTADGAYVLTFIRTAKASSGRSFEHNQRGDSGRQNMNANCMSGIAACIPTGILHAASVVYLTVPNTVHAAMIDPTY